MINFFVHWAAFTFGSVVFIISGIYFIKQKINKASGYFAIFSALIVLSVTMYQYAGDCIRLAEGNYEYKLGIVSCTRQSVIVVDNDDDNYYTKDFDQEFMIGRKYKIYYLKNTRFIIKYDLEKEK